MKARYWMAALALLGGSTLMVASDAFAARAKYEETKVTNGGAVSGKIMFKGTPPPPKLHELAKFPQPEFCGKVDNDGKGHRVQKLVRVSDGGMLQDVVVYIEEIEKGKPFELEEQEVHTDTCRFLVDGPSSFVGVLKVRGKLEVENLDADPNDPKSVDGVLHNPHTYNVYGSSSRTIFNKPLAIKGQKLEHKVKPRDFQRSPIMFLQCDQHNYMEAWFHKVENPYYAVVGPDGTFKIDQIPPGTYKLAAWHPIMKEVKEQEITVAADGSVTANFEFAEADLSIK